MPALRLADLEPVGLDARQATTGFADSPGDALRQVDVLGVEVDVVGDEERPGADRDRTGRRMESWGTEVGFAAALPDLGTQALVLAAADIGKLFAFGSSGGAGIEIDRELEPRGDPFTEVPSELDAIIHLRVAQGDERDDIDGADPGVLALVGVHVDLVDGDLDEPFEGGGHRAVLARDREDRAVVAGVARPVEQRSARGRADRVGHPVDDIESPALRDVGDGFDSTR